MKKWLDRSTLTVCLFGSFVWFSFFFLLFISFVFSFFLSFFHVCLAVLFLLSSLFFSFLSFYCFVPSLVFVFACFSLLFVLLESFFLCQIFQNTAVVWRWFIVYHNSLRALVWLCTSVGMFVSFYMSVSVRLSLTPSCSLCVFSVSTRNMTEAAPRPLIMTNRRWQAKDEEKSWREKRRGFLI